MLRMMLLAGAAAALLPSPCRAQPIDAIPLSTSELETMRGGFVLPMGIEANFGAVARTFSDDTLLLETHFTWTAAGVERENVLVSPLLGEAGAALTDGFELRDFNGATLIAHQAGVGGLRNVILNDASGRALRAEVQLTVTLPGFAAVQGDFSRSVLALRLGDDLRDATY
jgi:hypothetical protein